MVQEGIVIQWATTQSQNNSNPDETHRHCVEQQKPGTRVHTVWSHLCEVQEQAKLLHGQTSGDFGRASQVHGPVGVNWRYDKTWCVEGTGSSI